MCDVKFLNKELVRVASFSDHEAFDHPVICLVAVSSKDEQPISRFVDLFNTNKLPSLLNDGAMDPKVSKHYLLVHDNQDGPADRASKRLTDMRSTFGASDCSLLCINSSLDAPIKNQDNPWASYITDASPTPSQDLGCFLNIDDINEIKDLMQDLASKYDFNSIESQIRVLGDYAFMLGDYEVALSNYRLISTEYKIDKAWKRYAGVQMQSKISAFFKSTTSDSSSVSADNDDDLSIWEKQQHHIINTYTRRPPNPNAVIPSVVKNKKRSYAQFHLDFGQSDFLLRACSTCGINFTPGDPDDEKSHNHFHKSYTQGIQFRGWTKENVIPLPTLEAGRIILVSEIDLTSHRRIVEQVVSMMEIELGCGWILHDLFKVYLFVSLHRVVGCLVAEPIEKAFKVVSGSPDSVKKREVRTRSTTLRFGNVIFQREVEKKVASLSDSERMEGAIFCDSKPTIAACGIRAIWVAPSNRRKGIASKLLDAVRKSFCKDLELERSQLAFSQPTSAGKALATSYTGTGSFLAY
ncbi:N-acetyltransferase ESCO2 [Glycine soja]|nr:N-acetyltransferase ESCO2 [Glycine soja]